jgi:hypothetical protein
MAAQSVNNGLIFKTEIYVLMALLRGRPTKWAKFNRSFDKLFYAWKIGHI